LALFDFGNKTMGTVL